MTEPPVRVLLVDDDEIIRRTYPALLAAAGGIDAVAVAADAGEALELLRTRLVDVALVDVEMPGVDGVRLAAELARRFPRVRVLMMTAFESPDRVTQALHEGVQGFLTKDMPISQIVTSIRQAAAGMAVLGPGPAASVLSMLRGRAHREAATGDLRARVRELPPRLRPVVVLLAQGRTNRAIAKELGYTEGSVRTYVSQILQLLGCATRTELALSLSRAGYAPDGVPPAGTDRSL